MTKAQWNANYCVSIETNPLFHYIFPMQVFLDIHRLANFLVHLHLIKIHILLWLLVFLHCLLYICSLLFLLVFCFLFVSRYLNYFVYFRLGVYFVHHSFYKKFATHSIALVVFCLGVWIQRCLLMMCFLFLLCSLSLKPFFL